MTLMHRRGPMAGLARLILRLFGWKPIIRADLPNQCVIIVYPHTSNWDFPLGLFAKFATGLQVNFLGKHTLFPPMIGTLMRYWGGIPVNRGSAADTVGQMLALFKTRRQLRLVIAPEGTRKYTPTLKSGFYRIALAAKVPLGFGMIDYAKREVRLQTFIDLTGDPEADMARIREAYKDVRGFDPAKAGGLALPPAA